MRPFVFCLSAALAVGSGCAHNKPKTKSEPVEVKLRSPCRTMPDGTDWLIYADMRQYKPDGSSQLMRLAHAKVSAVEQLPSLFSGAKVAMYSESGSERASMIVEAPADWLAGLPQLLELRKVGAHYVSKDIPETQALALSAHFTELARDPALLRACVDLTAPSIAPALTGGSATLENLPRMQALKMPLTAVKALQTARIEKLLGGGEALDVQVREVEGAAVASADLFARPKTELERFVRRNREHAPVDLDALIAAADADLVAFMDVRWTDRRPPEDFLLREEQTLPWTEREREFIAAQRQRMADLSRSLVAGAITEHAGALQVQTFFAAEAPDEFLQAWIRLRHVTLARQAVLRASHRDALEQVEALSLEKAMSYALYARDGAVGHEVLKVDGRPVHHFVLNEEPLRWMWQPDLPSVGTVLVPWCGGVMAITGHDSMGALSSEFASRGSDGCKQGRDLAGFPSELVSRTGVIFAARASLRGAARALSLPSVVRPLLAEISLNYVGDGTEESKDWSSVPLDKLSRESAVAVLAAEHDAARLTLKVPLDLVPLVVATALQAGGKQGDEP